jgi:hypothetical protein
MRPKGSGIKIPQDFRETYLEAKNNRVTDREIAEGHFIDLKTLAKWKRLSGFKAGDFAYLKARRKSDSIKTGGIDGNLWK